MDEKSLSIFSFVQTIIITIGLTICLKYGLLQILGCLLFGFLFMLVINNLSIAALSEIKKSKFYK